MEPCPASEYVERICSKSVRIGTEVVYDVTTCPAVGKVTSMELDTVSIATPGPAITRKLASVFPLDECIKGGHWDHMTMEARKRVLKGTLFPETYSDLDWGQLPGTTRDILLKANPIIETGAPAYSNQAFQPGGKKRVYTTPKDEIPEAVESEVHVG